MPPKKRKSSAKQADTQVKQPKQDGQKAVSHDIVVPLDEGFKEDGEQIACAALFTFSPLYIYFTLDSKFFGGDRQLVVVYLVQKSS